MPVSWGKISRLCLIHAKIKIIALGTRAGLSTGIASDTLVVHIPRAQLDRNIKVAFLALDALLLLQVYRMLCAAVFNPFKLHLKAAVRWTELPEVLVHLRNSAAKIRVLLHDISLKPASALQLLLSGRLYLRQLQELFYFLPYLSSFKAVSHKEMVMCLDNSLYNLLINGNNYSTLSIKILY